MEKLQPVIKQMFWIMFGLALILMLWAWRSAAGTLSTNIAEQTTKVEKSHSDAKQPVASVPNSRWTEGAAEKNKQHKAEYDESARKLWQQQLKARVFPATIAEELNKLKFGSTITKKSLRGEFAKLYRTYFNEQLKTIQPFEQGEGLVEVTYNRITQENERRWEGGSPTSPEIWEAQEDIWLLRSIFNAIAEVNAGYQTIDKAAIRALQQLELRGGDPDAAPGATAASGFGASEEYPGGEMASSFGTGGPMMGAPAGGAQPWKAYEGSLATDLLVEEFGASAAGSTGIGLGNSTPMYEGAGEEEGGAGFGTAATVEQKRYVDEADELPYKTRAFILQVRMDQRRIPSLLAALTNSSFPVEIVRVDASFGSPVSGSGSSSAYGTSGMEYGEEEESYGSAGGGASFGATPGFGGGPGIGSGGGGAFGVPGASFAGPGRGLGSGRSRGAKTKRPDPRKSQLYAAAMADPNLSTVRVAGLMTLYENKSEKEAKADADVVAEDEAQDTEGVELPDVPKMGEETPEDAPTDGTTEPGTQAPATGESPKTPADGQTPADPGTATPAATDSANPTGDAAPADAKTPSVDGAAGEPPPDGTTPPADAKPVP